MHRESLFTEIFYNTYLHVNLIAQYDVRKSMQCAFHCLHINQCRSVNLKKEHQHQLVYCYMLFYVYIKIFFANAEIQRLALHRESLFREIFYNTYLHVNLIAQYDVRKSMQCAFHCLHINQCRSFNLKKEHQHQLVYCYMLFYVFIKIFFANAEIQRLALHRESLFREIFYNTYLHVNLIAQYDVRKSIQCAFHCLHINQCRYFNLKKEHQHQLVYFSRQTEDRQLLRILLTKLVGSIMMQVG